MVRFGFLIPFLYVISLQAQTGGMHSFEFLQIPGHAKLAGLGGTNISLTDDNINFLFSNPVLISDSLDGEASASYQFYLADIGLSTFSYGHTFRKIGFLGMGIQHMGYGAIQGYDPSGVTTQEYHSGETAIVISKSHQVRNYRVGINLKGVMSSIAGYRASALMIDLGGVFIHPKSSLTISLAIRNLGAAFSSYSYEGVSLPFDIQIGTTFKPEHMPLRFSFTAHHLIEPDISDYNPGSRDNEPGLLDKILRHLNFGTEILLHRNFTIFLGYNYLVHKELKLENSGGGAGISFGFSAHIKKVDFAFSRNAYVVGTAGYTFTVTTNVKNMLKRRSI